MSEIISKSPTTGDIIGQIPAMNAEQVKDAVEKARAASKSWALTSFARRTEILKNANQYMIDHFDEITALISRENGKPKVEAAVAEMLPAVNANSFFAENAQRLLADDKIEMFPWNLIGKKSYIHYVPWGVIGIISPWNYPFGIPMTQISMALAAGNTIVFKPSSSVALIGEKIKEIWEAAGLPEGVFNIIQGAGRIGEELIHNNVDRLIFTGSVEVGRHIAKLAGEALIPVTLELGGKDPAIVLDDADIDLTTSGILWGSMTNAGQTCAGIERVYVHRSVYDEFVEKISEKVKTLRPCDGNGDPCDVGAITTESQYELIAEQVKQAVNSGAIATSGNMVDIDGGSYFPPTILTNVHHGMPIISEENFGPVLPIMPFDSEEEAIRLANDSRFGLSASVWTSDTNRGERIAKKLIAGTVTINDSLYTYGLTQTPWGGVKESGYGKTHGKEGLMEMVRPVHIASDSLHRVKKPWWYPYDKEALETFKHVLEFLGGSGSARRGKAFAKVMRKIPLWRKL